MEFVFCHFFYDQPGGLYQQRQLPEEISHCEYRGFGNVIKGK